MTKPDKHPVNIMLEYGRTCPENYPESFLIMEKLQNERRR